MPRALGRAALLAAWLEGAACNFEATIPDRVVTCTSDVDCPQGFSCRAAADRLAGGLCCRPDACGPAAAPAADPPPAPGPSTPPPGEPNPAPGAPEPIPLPPVFEGTFTLAAREGGLCLELVGGQLDGASLQTATCRGSASQLFRIDQLSLGTYRLLNLQSNGCLEARGGDPIGAGVGQAACQSAVLEQSFRIEPSGGGHVLLVSLKSGRCLGLPAAGGSSGVIQSSCDQTAAQDWLPSRSFLATPNQIRVQHSGKCVEAPLGAPERTVLRQQACNRGNEQLFRVEPARRGRFQLVSAASGTCMDVPMSQVADGVQIWQLACSDTAAQWFRIEGVGGGADRIVNVNSGKCLAVMDSGGLDGAAIEQRTCSGADNQRWTIAPP